MKTCQYCGQPLRRGARFCETCGTPVKARQDTAYETGQEIERVEKQPHPSQNRSALLIGAVAAVLIILVATVILFLFFRTSSAKRSVAEVPDPTLTVTRLEEALNDLDPDGVAACFDAASQEAVRSELTGILDEFGIVIKLARLAVSFELDPGEVSYEDDTHCTVTVDGTAKILGDETGMTLEFPMVLEEGAWVIDQTHHPDTFLALGEMLEG